MFAVCEKCSRKPEAVEMIVSLLGQSPTSNHEYANGVGVDTP